VLRDDIRKLFSELSPLYKQKISKLQLLYNSDINNEYLLRSEDLEELLESIVLDDEIINDIDVIDFKISEIVDRLLDKLGLSPAEFSDFLEKSEEDEIKDIYNLRTRERDKIIEVFNRRETLMNSMEKKAASIMKDADELKKIIELKSKKNNNST